MTAALLGANDPSPVQVINPGGASPFLLIGDHAGKLVPESLAGLGLPPQELARHIGWDIGIGELGPMLAEALDAVFVRQTYSRLVIDCNRDPARADAMPEVSDLTVVPGNRDLDAAQRAARVAVIHTPYQEAIGAEIARRDAAGQGTILVALHSFTPMLRSAGQTVTRPWEIGVLHDGGDTAFAQALLAALRADDTLTVGDNEPYSMDAIDYTVPRHAYPARRPYAEIEVRQDLIGTAAGCADWSARLAAVLRAAASGIGGR
ncbi:N-formylglutamate amidohydrolase [Sphingomonas sp. Leaf357]|uniref:N-formylglutamate amidohydrolase n=1 Tax=Sphingomonas sp. Leaf357 TaxID=1736350 RepID=UPI0006FC4235|nr:N-formylglutamate amidohydrolase [Sphingomonas sp. Leaf357]KQS04999.1 N-formylglutamate amidohydrolase [Sphingomonas sp. Leaf357]